jgi:hypothetical protein
MTLYEKLREMKEKGVNRTKEPEKEPEEDHKCPFPKITLLIDVIAEVTDDVPLLLEDLTRDICKAIEQREKVEHWNLLDFAKGKTYLAIGLEEKLKEFTQDVMISTRSDSLEWRACGSVLRRLAKVIFVGVM